MSDIESDIKGDDREVLIRIFGRYECVFNDLRTAAMRRHRGGVRDGLWFTRERRHIAVYVVGDRLDVIHGRIAKSAIFSVHLSDPDFFEKLESNLARIYGD